MSTDVFPRSLTLHIAKSCLCLHAQRAARSLARHFDEVFRELDLTNNQFSMLMSLNRPEAPTVGQLAPFLAMDRTTLTALLKPLEKRNLVAIQADATDRRKRRIHLTPEGHAILVRAFPLWEQAHAALEKDLPDPNAVRQALHAVAPQKEPRATERPA